MNDEREPTTHRLSGGPQVVVPKDWRLRDVRLSDETWHAAIAQAAAERRMGRLSAPSLVAERALRLFLELDIVNESTAFENGSTEKGGTA